MSSRCICILAVLNSIALLSLGIKHALLFAVFTAFLNIIPFLGPIIGSILPIIFALLTKDSLWYPFGVFLSFYVIQVIESNYFTPQKVGNQVSMNRLMTIKMKHRKTYLWAFEIQYMIIGPRWWTKGSESAKRGGSPIYRLSLFPIHGICFWLRGEFIDIVKGQCLCL